MRRLIALFLAVLVWALPTVASAGGWSMAKFDNLPEEFVAGETYDLTYTILQHGETPVDVGLSSVVITDDSGKQTAFEATRIGLGTYRVSLAFPESGTFTWEVGQGAFAAHEMGSIEIAAPAAAAALGTGVWALRVALVLMIALIGWQILKMVRSRAAASAG